MCKTKIVIYSLFVLVISILFLAVSPQGHAAGSAGAGKCEGPLSSIHEPFFKLDEKNRYLGLTSYGVQVFSRLHETLMSNEKIMKFNFAEMEDFDLATTIAEVAKFNIMAIGKPGAAKTSFFELRFPHLWVKSVHAMMNEVPLIGGQTEQAAKEGREDLNMQGGILDHVKVAMIDEGEKLNPAVQAMLLRLLLNHGVDIQGKFHLAEDLRTVIYTGNATLPELMEYFLLGGQGNTAEAYLNRYQVKMFVPNRLSTDSQARLDKIKAHRDYLRAISQSKPEVLKDVVFEKPREIDADALQKFADAQFVLNDDAEFLLREMWEELTNSTNSATRSSVENNKSNPDETPHVLQPSVEFSERFRQVIAPAIRASAALDLLRSPLGTKENLEKLAKEPIKLGPLSIWRSYVVLTAVGCNRTLFDPFSRRIMFSARFNDQGQLIPYDYEYQIKNAKNPRDQLATKYVKEEQERFLEALSNQWKSLKNAQEEWSRPMPENYATNPAVDFEFRLAMAGGTNNMKLEQLINGQSGAGKPPGGSPAGDPSKKVKGKTTPKKKKKP